jgi:multiple sugar transport system substrate-binding protein
VTPANLDALHSDAFVQPLLDPIGADVFSSQMRYVHDLPDTVSWERVRAATAPELTQLFYDPVIDPLEARLSAIDLQSQPLFGPPPGTSPSPSS